MKAGWTSKNSRSTEIGTYILVANFSFFNEVNNYYCNKEMYHNERGSCDIGGWKLKGTINKNNQ
jgi:hypothetical protein